MEHTFPKNQHQYFIHPDILKIDCNTTYFRLQNDHIDPTLPNSTNLSNEY